MMVAPSPVTHPLVGSAGSRVMLSMVKVAVPNATPVVVLR